MSEILFTDLSIIPDSPASGKVAIFSYNGDLYMKDSSGSTSRIGSITSPPVSSVSSPVVSGNLTSYSDTTAATIQDSGVPSSYINQDVTTTSVPRFRSLKADGSGIEALTGMDSLALAYVPKKVLTNDDGKKLFCVDSGGDIHEYSLTVASDVTTATFVKTHTVVTGTFVFLSGGSVLCTMSAGIITEYSLTTAWDIDTATVTGDTYDTGYAGATDLYFKADAGMFWVLDGSSDNLAPYTFGTPLDFSTVTAGTPVSVATTTLTDPEGFHFLEDGTGLYVVGNQVLESFTLTAWDISTLTADQTKSDFGFDVSSVALHPSDNSHVILTNSSGSAIEYWLVGTVIRAGLQVQSGICVDDAELRYDPTSEELRSSKAFYAPVLRSDSGTIYVGGSMGISNGSSSLSMRDEARNTTSMLLGSSFDSTGSQVPQYQCMFSVLDIVIQSQSDGSSPSFSWTLPIPSDNITTVFKVIPLSPGIGTFEVRFSDASGPLMVSPFEYTFLPTDVGTVVDIPIPNPISVKVGETSYTTYSGIPLAGHVYSADPVFGTGFYPYLGISFQPVTRIDMATVSYVDDAVSSGGVWGRSNNVISQSNPRDTVAVKQLTDMGLAGRVIDAVNMSGPFDVKVSGTYAYVTSSTSGAFLVFDITSDTPSLVGSIVDLANLGGIGGLHIEGAYAYAVNATKSSLKVFDISTPASPAVVGTLIDATNLQGVNHIQVSGDYAYVPCATTGSLTVIDVSTPAAPTYHSSVTHASMGGAYGIDISGIYALVACATSNSLISINIGDPANPLVGGAVVDATALGGAKIPFVSGGYAYVTGYSANSVAVVDVTNFSAMVLKGYLVDATNLSGPEDIYVSGNFAYVSCSTSGEFTLLDISDPTGPEYVSKYTDSNIDGAKGFVVANDKAYLTAFDDASLTVIDLPGTVETVITGESITVSTLYGALASTVTATTQTPRDNSTKLATTEYVDNSVPSSTGILSGGLISIASSTTVSWTAGQGIVADYSDPLAPDMIPVSWSAATGVSVTNIATDGTSLFGYDKDGLLVQKLSTAVSIEDAHSTIWFGSATHLSGTVVSVVTSPGNLAYDGIGSFSDFINLVIGPANVDGNVYGSNGANLNINVIGGNGFMIGSNFRTDPAISDIVTLASGSAISFMRVYRSAGAGQSVIYDGVPTTAINPASYDDGSGTLQSVTAGYWTIQRIFRSRTGTTYVAYGQEEFSTKSGALAALGKETFIEKSPLPFLLYRCSLLVVQGATDLSLAAQAEFHVQSSFRLSGAQGGSASIPGVTSPGGSNKSVQFNNSSSFGGDSSLTYDTATKELTLDGKFTVTGLIDGTTGIAMTEQASVPVTPAAGSGYLWTKNTAPSTLIFTDDDGTDHLLEAGGGDVTGPASSVVNSIAIFDVTDGSSIDDFAQVTVTSTSDDRFLNVDMAVSFDGEVGLRLRNELGVDKTTLTYEGNNEETYFNTYGSGGLVATIAAGSCVWQMSSAAANFKINGTAVPDTDDVFTVVAGGTNGGSANFHVGSRNPEGNLNKPFGHFYLRTDGIKTGIYAKKSAGVSTTDWYPCPTAPQTTNTNGVVLWDNTSGTGLKNSTSFLAAEGINDISVSIKPVTSSGLAILEFSDNSATSRGSIEFDEDADTFSINSASVNSGFSINNSAASVDTEITTGAAASTVIKSSGANTNAPLEISATGTNGGSTKIYTSTVTPEGAVTADGGALCIQDSGTTSEIHLKRTDGGNTGWVALLHSGSGIQGPSTTLNNTFVPWNSTDGSTVGAQGQFYYNLDGATGFELTAKPQTSAGTVLFELKDVADAAHVTLSYNDSTDVCTLDMDTHLIMSTTSSEAGIRVISPGGTADAKIALEDSSNNEAFVIRYLEDSDVVQATTNKNTTFTNIATSGTFTFSHGITGQTLFETTGADTNPPFSLETLGANGAASNIFVGDRDPEGNVTAGGGSLYVRTDGVNSSLYVKRSATSTNTDWEELDGGDVDGPATSVVNAVAVFDTTDGSSIDSVDKVLITADATDAFVIVQTPDSASFGSGFVIKNSSGGTELGLEYDEANDETKLTDNSTNGFTIESDTGQAFISSDSGTQNILRMLSTGASSFTSLQIGDASTTTVLDLRYTEASDIGTLSVDAASFDMSSTGLISIESGSDVVRLRRDEASTAGPAIQFENDTINSRMFLLDVNPQAVTTASPADFAILEDSTDSGMFIHEGFQGSNDDWHKVVTSPSDGMIGTVYGGLGQYQNYLKYSEDIDNAAWTKEVAVSVTPNNIVSPNGQTTTDTVAWSSSSLGISQVVSLAASTTYTLTFWGQSVSGNPILTFDLGSTNKNITLDSSLRKYTLRLVTGAGPTHTFSISKPVAVGSFGLFGFNLSLGTNELPYAHTLDTGISTLSYGGIINGPLRVESMVGPLQVDDLKINTTNYNPQSILSGNAGDICIVGDLSEPDKSRIYIHGDGTDTDDDWWFMPTVYAGVSENLTLNSNTPSANASLTLKSFTSPRQITLQYDDSSGDALLEMAAPNGAEINSPLSFLLIHADDDEIRLRRGDVGTGGEIVNIQNSTTGFGIHADTQTPVGNTTGSPGDLHVEVNGASSTLSIHKGASSNNTDWKEVLTVDERTLVYSVDVDGIDETEFVLIGEYRVEDTNQTGDYADNFACNNQHAAIEVNSLTGSGIVTFTGVSMSESSGIPTATTETVTVDAVGKYQTDKKWLEITNIDIPAGITAINYDVEVLGYLDMQNSDFEVTGIRIDGLSNGNDGDFSIGIIKVQDDGSKKCSLVTIEQYGYDAKDNLIVDDLRTGGNDRSYTANSLLWTNGTNACLKVDDYSTYFTSDENVLEGSSKHEGIIIRFNGTDGGSIKNVSTLNLHLTIRML